MASALALVVTGTGCATGNSQTENTIAATYKTVKNLDNELRPAVQQLNETTAGLNSRVDETERQARALQSMLEEQQVTMSQMEKKVDSLNNTLHKQLGLTAPTTQDRVSPSTTSTFVDEVKVEPGPESTAPEAADAAKETEPELGAGSLQTATATPATTETTTPAPAPESSAPNAVAMYRKAYDDYTAKKYDVALTQFNQYLDQYKNTDLADRAQYWKGDCYFGLAQYDKAISEFETLRQTYPNSDRVPYTLYRQADAHLRLNQREKAKQLLTTLVEQYPMTAPAEKAAPALKKMQEGN